MSIPNKLILLKGGNELETDLADIAKIAALYRKALLREGVPAALASDLVRSWHDAFWAANEVEE